jgi:HSP20 family protein
MIRKKLALTILPLVASLSLQANDPFFSDPFGDDIFQEMMQMQRDMDQMFERMHQRIQKRSSALVSPLGTYKMAINNQLVDKGDHYELISNIPESKENNININTKNGLMSITAKIVEEQKHKTGNILGQSHSIRLYQQSISLPQDADENTIKIEYKKGKLIILISKKSASIKQDNKKRVKEINPHKNKDKKAKESK